MKLLIFFALILSAATAAFSAGPTDILGEWKTENDKAKVEIFNCGAELLCGKIVWVKNPKYTNDSKNPDPALNARLLVCRYWRDLNTKEIIPGETVPVMIRKTAKRTGVKSILQHRIGWN